MAEASWMYTAVGAAIAALSNGRLVAGTDRACRAGSPPLWPLAGLRGTDRIARPCLQFLRLVEQAVGHGVVGVHADFPLEAPVGERAASQRCETGAGSVIDAQVEHVP